MDRLRQWFTPRARQAPRPRVVPRLESLEQRCVPSMTQITNASTFPFSAAVEIRSIFPDTPAGSYEQGSGAMIDGDHVLTAGHMVYNASEGGWATQVAVYAGMTSANSYVVEAFAKYERTFDSFISDSQINSNAHSPGDGDIGLLTLGANIGSQTGWFGFGCDDGDSFAGTSLNTLGYPGVNYNGVSQYLQYGQISGTIAGTSGAFSSFDYSQSDIHQEGGQSGSPVYAYYTSGPNAGQSIIYGVMDVATSSTGYAERITSQVFTALEDDIQADESGSAGGDAADQRYELAPPVTPVSSTTALYASAATSNAGQSVTFTAYVSGPGSAAPTGTVTFYDGSTVLGTVRLSAFSGTTAYASFATSTLGVGNHSITAAYSGDANFKGSTSAAAAETVEAPPPATYVVSEIPGYGVWRYDSATGWQQLTPADASQVAVDARGDVVAEFSGYGVWRYEDSTGWQQLTPADAAQVGISGNGIVAAELPGYGVWRFEDATGWAQLTPANASQIAVAGNGIVAAELPGYGVWRYEDATGWQQLTPANASQGAVDAGGDVAVELPGYGVWRYEDAGGWQQLRSADASSLSISGAGVVAAEFSGAGVWRYEDGTGWEQLTPADASQVAVDANGDVAGDFGIDGVWLYQDGLSWGQLSSFGGLEIGAGG